MGVRDDCLFLCINIPGETERRERMQAIASSFDFPMTFIDGVDGRTIRRADVEGYDEIERLRRFPAGLTNGELACFESHRKALRHFLSSDAEYCTIFEDNALPDDRFGEFLKQVDLRHLRFDMLRLIGPKRRELRHKVKIQGSFSFSYDPSVSRGAWGNIYSRSGAERILNSMSQFWHGIDQHLGFFWKHKLRILTVEPPLVSRAPHDTVPSVIDRYGQSRNFGRASWRTPLRFIRARHEVVTHEIMKHIYAFLSARRP